MSDEIWKLSPSDFAFLWEECKRCFYLKVVKGFSRPRTIMPRIFKIIDSQMKVCFAGQRIESLVQGIKSGIIKYADEWVESQPIRFADIQSSCRIRGKFDTIVKFDDDTYGVIDFKASEVTGDYISIYSRQLHAYAYALENPVSDAFSCGPVDSLGLIIYEPKAFSCNIAEQASLNGSLNWLEIPRNDNLFLEFMHAVLTLLDKPELPEPSASCEWCQYRKKSRSIGL